MYVLVQEVILVETQSNCFDLLIRRFQIQICRNVNDCTPFQGCGRFGLDP